MSASRWVDSQVTVASEAQLCSLGGSAPQNVCCFARWRRRPCHESCLHFEDSPKADKSSWLVDIKGKAHLNLALLKYADSKLQQCLAHWCELCLLWQKLFSSVGKDSEPVCAFLRGFNMVFLNCGWVKSPKLFSAIIFNVFSMAYHGIL